MDRRSRLALFASLFALAGCAATAPEPTQHYTNVGTLEAVYPHPPPVTFGIVHEALERLPVVVLRASPDELELNAASTTDTTMVLAVRLAPEGADSTRLHARLFYRLFERDGFRHLAYELASATDAVLRAQELVTGTVRPQAVFPEGAADCAAISERYPVPRLSREAAATERPPAVVGGMGALSKRLRYPLKALERRVEGMVYVRVLITPSGEAACAEVVAGLPEGLNEAALGAVMEAEYRPARYGGEPVRTSMTLPILFGIR